MPITDPTETAALPALTLARVIAAPREAVFAAWLDPALLARWLGPAPVAAEIDRLEPWPGGAWRVHMRRPDGAVHTVGGVYRAIVPPERLVFTWTWESTGAALNLGRESLVTLTFAARGDGTELTLRHERFVNRASLRSHRHGWTGTFDRLAALLVGSVGR
jgi:uncharacterized protein YndB with AHSA1/START domain